MQIDRPGIGWLLSRLVISSRLLSAFVIAGGCSLISATDTLAQKSPVQMSAMGDHSPVVDGQLLPGWKELTLDKDEEPLLEEWNPWNPTILPMGKVILFSKEGGGFYVICGRSVYLTPWRNLCLPFLPGGPRKLNCERSDLGKTLVLPPFQTRAKLEARSKKIYLREEGDITQITCFARFSDAKVDEWECKQDPSGGQTYKWSPKPGDATEGAEFSFTTTSIFSCLEAGYP